MARSGKVQMIKVCLGDISSGPKQSDHAEREGRRGIQAVAGRSAWRFARMMSLLSQRLSVDGAKS
jgi:hypothetical protein